MFKNCARGYYVSKELLKTVTKTAMERQHQIKTKTRNEQRGGSAQQMRRWEHNKNKTSTTKEASSINKQYTLLSYNILAQDLLTEHLYLYLDIQPQLLTWEKRLQRLREEVLHLNPDIVCLQEMQYNHLKTFVAQIRGQKRLEYIYKKRTGARSDGCAIIYDRDKFRMVEERAIEYHTPGISSMNRENIALLAKFQLRDEPAKNLIVATTHLLYNPRRDDVRCAQIECLLAALNAFARRNNARTKGERSLPIILTGDFNSQQHSPPYALLTAPHPLELETAKNCREDPLQLASLNFGRNTASTHQNEWITVDYVLHSIGGKHREQVKIWSIYKLPAVPDCRRMGQIPNWYLGSDHFSQAIRFSVI